MGKLSARPSLDTPLAIARLISALVQSPRPAFSCEVMFGAVELTGRRVHAAEIVVAEHRAGIQLDQLRERGDRLIVLSLLPVQGPEVEIRLLITRLDVDHPLAHHVPEAAHRRPDPEYPASRAIDATPAVHPRRPLPWARQ